MAQNPPPQRQPRPSESKPAGAPAGTGGSSADVERALALRDVMDHAVRVEREISKPTPLGPKRGRQLLALLFCVPALAFSVFSFVMRPEFIWGQRSAALPPERVDANLRFAMYLLAQRIEQHRQQSGAYPESLASLGEASDGLTYAALSDSVFELRAVQGGDGKPIVLRSNESMDAFLGNSAAIIQGQSR